MHVVERVQKKEAFRRGREGFFFVWRPFVGAKAETVR
jgi:hypothetical protein